MRSFLLMIMIGAIVVFCSPVSWADDLIDDSISPSQAHLQIVNQELDKVEYSGNVQAAEPSPQNNTESPVVPAVRKSQASSPSRIIYKRAEIDFGSDIYWAKYNQPDVQHQKGFLSGYNTSFTFRPVSPSSWINMYRLEGQWASGKFTFQSDDGSTFFQGIKDNTYDIRGLMGKEFYPTSYLRASGYSGFGYRYLNDNPSGLTDNEDGFTIQGYQTISHYCYVPFGTDILFQTDRNYSLDTNLEFDYMVRGWEVSELGVIQGYNTIVNDQNKGIGFRASLRLNLYFKYFTAYAETFFRYWNIGQSDSLPDPTDPTNPPLYVPKNNTQEYGFRLGLEI